MAQESNGSDGSGVELEQVRRLKVHGITYEEAIVNNQGTIKVTGGNVIEGDLANADIDNIVRFFVGFQRRTRREGGAVDGRGQVRDPAHDARLKGNESQRPSDPNRNKQKGKSST
jgi:hypothetical protein